MTFTISHCCVRFSGQRLSGLSLIECLVVNALALVLLSILLATSADMISAAQKAGDRSEQAIRARQVFDFLDSLVRTAQLPDTWTTDDITSEGEAVQYSLMDPCQGVWNGGDSTALGRFRNRRACQAVLLTRRRTLAWGCMLSEYSPVLRNVERGRAIKLSRRSATFAAGKQSKNFNGRLAGRKTWSVPIGV